MSEEEDLKVRKEAIAPPATPRPPAPVLTAVPAPNVLPSAPVIPGFVNGKVAKRAEDMKTNGALKRMTAEEIYTQVAKENS